MADIVTTQPSNQEIAQTLNNGLVELGKWAGQAKDFVMDQAPQLAKEVIWQGMFQNAVGIFVAILLVLMATYLIKKIYKWKKKEDEERSRPEAWYDHPAVAVPTIAYVVLLLGMISLFLYHLYWILIGFYCPRYYLIHELASFLGKK